MIRSTAGQSQVVLLYGPLGLLSLTEIEWLREVWGPDTRQFDFCRIKQPHGTKKNTPAQTSSTSA